jgi:polysaccharide export outer membrane protein
MRTPTCIASVSAILLSLATSAAAQPGATQQAHRVQQTTRAQQTSPAPAPKTAPATTEQAASTLTQPVGTTGTLSVAPNRSGAVSPDYRLGPGDKLRVEVYKDTQLSQSLQVRPDGKITLPLVGDLQASGLTPIELRDRIATALREYVTNPVVTVIVVETIAPLVYIMGEVNNPGSISMQGPISVLQALAIAGGFKDFANTKNIKVLRRTSRGQQTIAFNYRDALRAEGPPMMLQPGDTVVVP